MKVAIVKDEWYPVYSIVKDSSFHDYVIDLTPEQIQKINRTERAFLKAQKIIEDIVEGE
jgi:hypothetical protein